MGHNGFGPYHFQMDLFISRRRVNWTWTSNKVSQKTSCKSLPLVSFLFAVMRMLPSCSFIAAVYTDICNLSLELSMQR